MLRSPSSDDESSEMSQLSMEASKTFPSSTIATGAAAFFYAALGFAFGMNLNGFVLENEFEENRVLRALHPGLL